MTERLYYTDSHRLDFEARVVEAFERDGRTLVVLDRSAFYPTGGGQPHDTGTLKGAKGEWHVDDVLAEADATGSERVLHVVSRDLSEVGEAATLPAVGATLAGKVDGVRRRDHLQQHTGQHVLSQAFVQVAQIETKSFHLGAAFSTIDVEPRVTDEVAAKAVALANDVVFSDRPLLAHEVGADELERFKIRRQTFHGDRIRLVEIEGFDVSTCGGTHAHRTGEIGLIAVTRVEKTKGLHRVEFVCGGRALRVLDERRKLVDDAARLLSTAAEQVPTQIEKLLAAEKAARKRAKGHFELAAEAHSVALLAKATPAGKARVVHAKLDELTFEEAQLLARKLTAGAGVIALLGLPEPPGGKLLFARSNDLSASMSDLVKQVAERFGGRGGGSPASAQAAIARAADLDAALAAAREALDSSP